MWTIGTVKLREGKLTVTVWSMAKDSIPLSRWNWYPDATPKGKGCKRFVEMDPQRIHEANENAQKAKVDDRVQFLQQDLFQTDLSKATVVTLYLLPELNKKLRPRASVK